MGRGATHASHRQKPREKGRIVSPPHPSDAQAVDDTDAPNTAAVQSDYRPSSQKICWTAGGFGAVLARMAAARRQPQLLEPKDAKVAYEALAMGIVSLAEEALEIAVRNAEGRKAYHTAAGRLVSIGISMADLARAMALVASARQ